MSFAYILSYNPSATQFSANQLHALIESSRFIETWYLAFGGTYVFKSQHSITDINASLLKFFEGGTYILTYAIPTLMGGLLPPTIWGWLNDDELPKLEGKD